MRRTSRFVAAVLLAALLPAAAGDARAQEAPSSAADEAGPRERKAGESRPPAPGLLERRMLAIERAGESGTGRGLSVAFGDIKRGSGPSIGPSYRRPLPGGATLAVKAGYSIRNAKMAQVSLQSPHLAGGRVSLRTRARWQDVPDVAFYGPGAGVPCDPASYAERMTEVSAAGVLAPARLVQLGAGIGLEDFATSIGRRRPERAALFTAVPGTGADPRYLHGHATAAIDSRDSDSYTRRGSLLRAELHDYRQQDGGRYSFRRIDATAEQYIPLLRGNGVIYLGLRASTTAPARGAEVPYFLLPDLGGHDLRGFATYRFRNRHAVLFTGEYRWYAHEFVDGAIFYDAGKTVSRRGDLGLDRLHGSYGAGVRFHGRKKTVLRLDVARSREGTRLVLSFSPVGG